MKFKITYWDAGDCLLSREVEAKDQEMAIGLLVDDPQNPLAQVKMVETVDEDEK